MKKNVGGWDRNLRFIVGGAALAAVLGVPMKSGWKALLAAVGISELVTASTEYCPLNEAMNINTRRQSLPEAAENAAEEALAYA